jgi:hypothetical protein
MRSSKAPLASPWMRRYLGAAAAKKIENPHDQGRHQAITSSEMAP